jgi:hypothetical protein
MADEPVARVILTLRLVFFAIAAGIVVFGTVAAVLVAGGTVPARPELGSLLLPALLVAAVLTSVAFLVVRQAILAGLPRTDPAVGAVEMPLPTLLGRFHALTIVGGALAELPSLFGIVVFLLTRQWIALLVPILGLVVLVLLIPSRDRFTRFTERVTRSRDI